MCQQRQYVRGRFLVAVAPPCWFQAGTFNWFADADLSIVFFAENATARPTARVEGGARSG
jgi:hypothetical protein